VSKVVERLDEKAAWQLRVFKDTGTIINSQHLQQVPGQSAAASEERKRQHHWASRHALL